MQRLSIRILALFGWKVTGALPAQPRFVLIVAPHTSNWDFPIGVLAMFAVQIRLTWLGKHTLFVFPVARLLRWLGGEPVDRRVRGGLVEQAIERFRTRPQWVLAIAPEGTRKRVEQWKTGFYRIAIGAGVPVLPVAIDFSKKALDLGTLYWPVGDETQDLAALRARYHAGMAKFPGEYGG
ncbi:MAG: lysophospholipid acyltransferase family protein [Gemmatimonadales bacterium]